MSNAERLLADLALLQNDPSARVSLVKVGDLDMTDIARVLRLVDQVKGQAKGIGRLRKKLDEMTVKYEFSSRELSTSRKEVAALKQTIRNFLDHNNRLAAQLRAAGMEPCE